MELAFDIIINTVISFAAVVSISVILNAPRKELIFCGICGSLSWMAYYVTMKISGGTSADFAVLLGVMLSACACRIFSYARKMPVTIYLIGAIMPLVPGTGIYYTMYAALKSDTTYALEKGIEALKIAGIIAIGIIMVLSLPGVLFDWKRGKTTAKTK